MTNQKIKQLYDDFFTNNEHYVYGGIVDEEEYKDSNNRLLFLLKEVIDESKSEHWFLVDLLNDQISKQKFIPMWQRVDEWSFGLHNGFPSYQYHVTGVHKLAIISEGLSKIATTNLKKSGGKNQSRMEEIREEAIKNEMLWTDEIKLIGMSTLN